MNILILNWRDPKNPMAGGAEYVTFEHAKSWVKKGHTVLWLTSRFPHSQKRETLEGVEIVRKGNHLSLFLYAPVFYLFSGYSFTIVIDEIHGIPFFTPLYVQRPIIAFIHEVAGEIWNYAYPFPLNHIGRFIESFSFGFYRKIPFWTDASSTIDELQKIGIQREHCIAIPCPIRALPTNDLSKKEARPTFIFVSRIVAMKGIEDVLDAFSIILQSKKDAQLWIVGSGKQSYLKKLKEKVKDLGLEQNLVFFGFIPENKKLELLKRAHLLLHASVKEGWGLVVLEAASQGTPSVAYNVSGLRDTIKDKKTGILVFPKSPRELAKAAISLLEDQKQYKAMQKAGIEWISSLNWENVTERSMDLIYSTVNKKHFPH